MSIRRRKQIKRIQRIKRHKERLKLLRQGLNPDEYFSRGYYIARNV